MDYILYPVNIVKNKYEDQYTRLNNTELLKKYSKANKLKAPTHRAICGTTGKCYQASNLGLADEIAERPLC